MTLITNSPIKALRRGAFALVCAALLIPLLASAPKANAQVSLSVQIGPPPVCPYGYYDYPPYPCARPGFYGPGYFYNGIFLGVGPWANWGYTHGWGRYRFVGPRGGVYYPGYWNRHPHVNPGHRWDHSRAYGYYAHRAPGRAYHHAAPARHYNGGHQAVHGNGHAVHGGGHDHGHSH